MTLWIVLQLWQKGKKIERYAENNEQYTEIIVHENKSTENKGTDRSKQQLNTNMVLSDK